MPTVNFTSRDMKSRKVLDNGWYTFRVEKVFTKPAKGDASTNYVWDFIGISGDSVDVPLRVYFSEKFLAPMSEVINSVSPGAVSDDGGAVDIEACVGRELDIYIERGEYQGRPQNQASAYAPAGQGGR